MPDLIEDLQSALRGTYALERELGGGGMSRVFLATEEALGRRVVIKVLPANFSIDLSAERFAREIQLAAALQHPCIVPVLRAGLAGNVPFYTMPYVAGRTLRDRLVERKMLAVPEAMDILRDVASALAHAHAHDIVHRDIKPENILLSGGYAQVTDFGIARAISASRTAADIDRARITQAGLVIGSPTYMAPEQVAGDDGMDQRADIYALGCLAYELFAGVPPFNATDPHLILRAHVSETPADVRTHRPDLPADIASVVMRSLEKDRALRPQTAGELAEFFRAPRPVSAPRPPRKSAPVVVVEKIPRWAWYMTFTTAIAAVGAGVFAVWPRKPVEESIAVLPFTNMSGDTAQSFFADGIASDLTNALAEIPGLRVASRTSAFAFKGRSIDPRDVGKQLDVTEILEGSVRRTGAGLRINAMLIRARDGKSRWTQTFDRPDSDLFAVQDEITRSIARALHIKLRHGDSSQTEHVSSIQAHEAYLHGLANLNQSSEPALRRAIDSFNQAIALDTEHARAHAGLATAYTYLADVFVQPSDAYPQAIAEANRAIELDSTLAEGMATLGLDILVYNSDPEAAKALFDQALRQNPNSARAYEHLSWYELAMRRPKRAVVAAQRAFKLDPLSPTASSLVEWWWLMAREPDSTIAQHKRTSALASEYVYHDSFAGEAFRQKGMLTEALAEYDRASKTLGHATSGHIITLHALGRTDEARKLLQDLEANWPKVYVAPELLASAHARLGDFDGAMQWLEKGAEVKSGLTPLVGVLYDLEPLHDDPRYEALLKRLGIPEQIDMR